MLKSVSESAVDEGFERLLLGRLWRFVKIGRDDGDVCGKGGS
jgi:hypothetical protein